MYKYTLAILSTVSLLSAAPFSEILSDDAEVVLSLRSSAEMRESWETHPIADVVNDESLQDFLAPLFSSDSEDEESFTEVMEDEFGLTWDEFFELLPGQFAFVVYNMTEQLLSDGEVPFDLAIMAEFSGDEERMNELMQIQFDRNAAQHKEWNPLAEHKIVEEEFMGETLYFDEAFDGEESYVEDGYALVDGIFILATTEERMRTLVESIKDGADSPLAETTGYLRAREKGGKGDLSFYLNLEAVMPPLNEALLDTSMQGGAAMMGLSAKSLDAALGLEFWQGLFIDVDLVDEGLRSYSGFTYSEKKGLLSLFTYNKDSLPSAPFVPEDVFSSSLNSFDLGAMLEQLENLFGIASPTMLPLMEMQLQQVKSQSGVDLRRSLLENLGDELISLSILPNEGDQVASASQPDQVIVLSVLDGEALSSAVETLMDLSPGTRDFIETQEFAGQTIYTIPTMSVSPDQADSSVSYVITRSHFILSVGSVGLLHEVLTRMDGASAGFWERSEILDMFDLIEEPNVVSRSYINMEKMVLPILHSVVEGSQLSGADLRLEDIPADLEVPFHVVYEMNEESDGFFSRALLIKQ